MTLSLFGIVLSVGQQETWHNQNLVRILSLIRSISNLLPGMIQYFEVGEMGLLHKFFLYDNFSLLRFASKVKPDSGEFWKWSHYNT